MILVFTLFVLTLTSFKFFQELFDTFNSMPCISLEVISPFEDGNSASCNFLVQFIHARTSLLLFLSLFDYLFQSFFFSAILYQTQIFFLFLFWGLESRKIMLWSEPKFSVFNYYSVKHLAPRTTPQSSI